MQKQYTKDELDINKIYASILELRESTSKLSEAQDRTDEQMKQTAEQMKQTDEQMKQTDEQMKRMGIHVNGISKSQGLDAEAFFLSSLEKKPFLGDVQFDIVSTQRRKRSGSDEYQMDIFLENGNSVGIVEVKNKAKLDDLNQLESLVNRFEKFYTTHAGMKKYAAIAAKIMPDNVAEKALEKGFFVLTQQGDHIEVTSPLVIK